MKHMKKMIALGISIVMALGTMSMAFADDPVSSSSSSEEVDYDANVTVTGLSQGDVAHFYKVLAWNGDNPTGTVSGWYATTDYTSKLTEAELRKILIDDPATTTGEKDPTGITAELAGQLAKLAKTAVADVTVGSDGKAVLDVTGPGLGAGMYMVLVTPKDMDTVYNPVFVSSDYTADGNSWAVSEAATYSDEAAAKKSTTTLDKSIVTDATKEDSWDDKNNKTTAIGDIVDFKVTSTIPAFGTVFENPSFVLTDTLQDLALVIDTDHALTVTPAEYDSDGKGTMKPTYTTNAEDGSTSYTITFDKDYLKTLSVPQAITITYSAIVTSTALKNVNPEDNTVQVEFTNNPKDESSKGAKFDETHNYTFTIDAETLFGGTNASGKKGKEIVKVGVDAEGNPINSTTEVVSDITTSHKQLSPLADAEFKLYTDAACNNEYIPKNADGTAGTAGLVIKSGADGRMTIKGLDAGTYYLKETKAPKGYVKDPRTIQIDIQATIKTQDITKYWNGSAWSETKQNATDIAYTAKNVEILESYKILINGVEAASHQFINTSNNSKIQWSDAGSRELPSSIVNTQGVELPSTGGMGTTIFYIIGAILVLGAGILLVTRRRMSAN